MPLHREPHARGTHAPAAQGRLPVRALHAARELALRFLRAAPLAALALLLGACATPPLDRYLLQAEADITDVRFKGSRGVLTRAQSKTLFEQIKSKTPGDDVLEHHLAVEQALSDTPLSIGNKVALLEDGAQTYAAMLAAIRGAKHHVHMETYIFDGDDVGRQFAAALAERARAGLDVRLIYDAAGSFKTPKEFFGELAASGVKVVEYNPLSPGTVLTSGLEELNHRDHRKLTVVDTRVAFVGGINISSVYGSTSNPLAKDDNLPFDQRPWRDMQSRIEGPVVADLERAFLAQWAAQKKEDAVQDKAYFPQLSAQGSHVVRVIEGSPSQQNVNAMYVALISAIENAEKEVRIMNPYFVPHESLCNALENAARRGVDVRLVLPSHSDSRLAYHAGRSYYGDLLEAGVRIFERNDRMLHAKAAIVDGVWSTVGSTNLDWRSLLYNDEINIVVIGPEFAAQMNRVFGQDLKESEEITPQKWRDRSLKDRFKDFGASVWARFL
ncbi:MAG: cardiolipin synthase [Usitatibacter sp.]